VSDEHLWKIFHGELIEAYRRCSRGVQKKDTRTPRKSLSTH